MWRAGDLVNFVEECVRRSFVDNNSSESAFVFVCFSATRLTKFELLNVSRLTLQRREKKNLGTIAPRIVVTPWD